MPTYKSLKLGELIELLDTKDPEWRIFGISNDLDSYRGYYEHVAIEPVGDTTAGSLSAYLKGRIGDTMFGYKGGDYEIKPSCYVFVARYGDTGGSLGGFTEQGEPVTFESGWF